MADIPDFSDRELWVINTTLAERYGTPKELQQADAEIRLHANDRTTTQAPVVVWEHGGCHFVIFKSGEHRYRSQFFYEPYKQYGTGVPEFDDITNCVVTTLQNQADQEARRKGSLPKGPDRSAPSESNRHRTQPTHE